MEWLANNESSLSAIAAIIAIIAGVAVVARLIWTRMPAQVMSQVKRPAFLSDWRNVALIVLGLVAGLAVLLLATGEPESPTVTDELAPLVKVEGKPSVAVLPLNYLSDDQSQAYLADGIAEDVITLLSRNPRFFVIARNSSFTYRGQSVDIRQVGEELGVSYVVEGSVRKSGERLRVTVQLIDTSNGQHLWAEQYDRPFEDIFALQDEITNGIAVALGDEIFQAEIARASSTSTDNLDAWGLVMRASRALTVWNSETSMEAVTLFRAALELDPDYALAKAELARTLCWRASNQWGDNPTGDITKAYSHGEQALKLAPNDPLVLYGVGACYGSTGRADEGVRLLKRAVTKQPNFAIALGMLGLSYTLDGQAERALPYGDQALQLAPQSPYIYLFHSWQSSGLIELGRYEEAEQSLQNAIESYDGWWWTWQNLAAARSGQGDIEGAQQALRTARKKEVLFSRSFTRASAAVIFKNKGKNLLAALEPIWPEDLLRSEDN